MTKSRIVLHIICLATLLGLGSCSGSEYEVDTSGIELDMQLIRFEKELYACNNPDEIAQLVQKYPVFFRMYTSNIMPLVPEYYEWPEEKKMLEYYKYIKDRDVDSLYKLAARKFGDFSSYRKEFEEAAKYINFYFPDHKIDTLFTYISAFNYGSIYIQDFDAFAVGLDMYMGRDFEVYGLLDAQFFPQYRINRLEPEYIVPNAVKSFLYYIIPKTEVSTFIDDAVYEGKVLYMMDRLLPRTPDSLKIGYAMGKMEWNKANEANIWAYFIEQDILFSSDKNDYYKKYFNDGPFTTPLGNESPPRVGAWLGWQIVKAYMEKHPGTTVEELLAMVDHQKLFRDSSYKP